MNWYGVKFLLKAKDSEGITRLAEETVRLVSANSFDEAIDKTKALLKEQEENTDVTVTNGERSLECKWDAGAFLDAFHMFDDPADNVEVFSIILQADEAEMIENMYNSIEDNCTKGEA